MNNTTSNRSNYFPTADKIRAEISLNQFKHTLKKPSIFFRIFHFHNMLHYSSLLKHSIEKRCRRDKHLSWKFNRRAIQFRTPRMIINYLSFDWSCYCYCYCHISDSLSLDRIGNMIKKGSKFHPFLAGIRAENFYLPRWLTSTSSV